MLMNNRECQTDISGNSLFIKWVMITAPLAILAGFGKFGDLVNRIVGSNSKIGNFTILKFLFSHSQTKNINRKLTIPTNSFSARLKIAITQKTIIYKTLASGWFHRIYPFENGHAITNNTRREKDPDFLKNCGS